MTNRRFLATYGIRMCILHNCGDNQGLYPLDVRTHISNTQFPHRLLYNRKYRCWMGYCYNMCQRISMQPYCESLERESPWDLHQSKGFVYRECSPEYLDRHRHSFNAGACCMGSTRKSYPSIVGNCVISTG